MRGVNIVLSIVLLLGSVATAAEVVMDDFDGTLPHRAFGGLSWSQPDTLTGNDDSQLMLNTDISVDASEFGWDETADVPTMLITMKANAGNTLTTVYQVMVKDAADHRWMFYFDDLMVGADDEWVTTASTSSNRQAEGNQTGEFDWSTVARYWIQMFDHPEGSEVNVTFDKLSFGTLYVRGAAHTPVPTGETVDSRAVSSVSWYSPEQDENGDFLDDPNIVSVDGYDVWWSIGQEPNYVDDTPEYQAAPDQDYTPATPITFETTYYWRVDTHVTWDSNEFTGTESLSSIVQGAEWEFTTLPDYLPPVLALDNVHTTLDLMPAVLAAEITENSTDIVSVTFELLTDDVEFPAGSDAVLTDTTSDNQMPTAELDTTTPGTYKVKLVITDEGNLPVQEPTTLETVAEVVIYDDLCQAAKDAPDGYAQLDYDLDNNCVVELNDFALIAAEWLTDAFLDAQQGYTGVADYVPQDVFDLRIEAEWIDPNDPNACSDGPISDNVGIRIEDQPNASGGQALGFASATAWVEYTVDVPVSAVGVAVDVYAGHALSGTGTVTLSFGTEAAPDAYGVGTLNGTGGWKNFTGGRKIGEVTFTTSGPQIVRTSYGGGLNLDWFSFDF